MADAIVKGILSLDIEYDSVSAGLKDLNSQLNKTNSVFQEQENQLNTLVTREAELVEARKRANNPTVVAKYNKELETTRKDIDNIKKSMDLMAASEKKLEQSTQSLNSDLKSAFSGTQTKGLENGIKNIDKESKNLSKSTDKLGLILAGAFTIGAVTGFGKKIIETRAEFQKFQAVLTNTLGSGQLAEATLGRIQDFASKTPFAVTELTASFVKLANQGFQPTNDELRSLGDLAAAQGKSFDQLTEAIIDAQTGEFERLKEFGIRASKQGDQVKFTFKGVQTQTKFTSDEIRKYILSLGDLEGVSGGMAAVSETLGGKISNLGDNFDALFNNLGEQSEGIFALVLDQFNDLLGKINETEALLNKVNRSLKGTSGELTFADRFKGAEIPLTATQKLLDNITGQAAEIKNVADAEPIYNRLNNLIGAINKSYEKGLVDVETYNRQLLLAGRAIESVNAQVDNLKKLQQDAGKKQAEDLTKEYEKGAAALEKLLDELLKIQSDNRLIDYNDSLRGLGKINEKFDELQLVQDRLFGSRRDDIQKTFKIAAQRIEAENLLNQIQAEERIKLERERTKALIAERKNLADETNKLEKETAELTTQLLVDGGVISEAQAAEKKLEILQSFNQERVNILQQQAEDEFKAGINTIELQKQIKEEKLKNAAEESKIQKEILDNQIRIFKEVESEDERHQLALLGLEEDSQIAQLEIQLQYAKLRKDAVLDEINSTESERLKAINEVDELERRLDKEKSERRRKNLSDELDYWKQVIDAALNAASAIVDSKIKEVDQLRSLQERRVEDARQLADKGNAELLELEKKRLDDLNKERANYVRKQQSLAVLELIADSAVAIAKAAAQGGAAAPFTITATLLALIAGLAQAKAVASQAAFYKGGEFGYTGDGNPKGESLALGDKPYTYHKREFIFNHDKTDKYRDIFHKIHNGHIDLNEWRSKVNAFDEMKKYQLNTTSPVVVMSNPQKNEKLESLMNEVVMAIRGQERVSFSMDADGFSASVMRRVDRANLIKKLAK